MKLSVEALKKAADIRLQEIELMRDELYSSQWKMVLKKIENKNINRSFFCLKPLKVPTLEFFKENYGSFRNYMSFADSDPKYKWFYAVEGIKKFLRHLDSHIGDTIDLYAKDIEYYQIGVVIEYAR